MSYATLLVVSDLNPKSANRLKIAADLAQRFKARVIGIAAQAVVLPLSLAQSDAFADADVWAQSQAEIAKLLQEIEERFRGAFKDLGTPIEWRSEVTEPVPFIARESRAADLIIAGKDLDDTLLDPSDLVLQAGRPALLIPNETESLKAERLLIAWKDTREARRAIHDALPLLRQSQKIIVAEIDEDENPAAAARRVADVVAWLASHGVNADGVSEAATTSPAAQLDQIAAREDADIIIAGAYGHGRFREWVFGGVTHDLFLKSSRTQFFAH
ncbi:MAG TPA: universal stress protein [Methylocella sp.]|nr:universal stress protein [Methylocella sp.]